MEEIGRLRGKRGERGRERDKTQQQLYHITGASYQCIKVPYNNLKYSRIKYFAVWLNSAQKQIFTDKIFVVEHESCTYIYNKY